MKQLILLAALWPIWLQAAEGPSVLVKLQDVQQRDLQRTVTAYGKVSPDPDAISTVNTGRDVIVTRIRVTSGQKVAAGDKLVTLETAPAARLAYKQAETEEQFAREDLERQRRLLQRQLATHADVAAAEKTLKSAVAALQAQKELGNDAASSEVKAPFAGIVTEVTASPGQRLPAGGAVLSLSRRDRLIVRLGVEPEIAPAVPAGAPVRLSRIFGEGGGLDAVVDQIQGLVDPQTRLVDVLVRLQGADTGGFLPGMQVRGRITLERARSLAVPRSAVLRDDQGAYLFVVRGNSAQRVSVDTGISSGQWVGVTGTGLAAGDRVVIEGNYELSDGARVREATE